MPACDPLNMSVPDEPIALDGASAVIESLRREVAELEAELARSDRLATLGAMSGAVAHEINNLLTPLLSYAGFALTQPDDSELSRRALERTVQTAERARDVVESLLRTVRVPSTSEMKARVCVLHAVEDAIGMMIRPPQASGIEMIIDVPGDLVAGISPASLQQIVLNLLLNACEAMQQGPGSIVVKASKYKQDANRSSGCSVRQCIELRVIDTGPGVRSDLCDRVFEPLISSKSGCGRERQQGGTGLGLTVCKRLVEQVGGSISLRSEAGVGSCFTVTLPALEAESLRKAA